MTGTPLLFLALAFVAATGFSLQDSQSHDGMPSALTDMADWATARHQPESESALQREVEELTDLPTLARFTRRTRRSSDKDITCCGSEEKTAFSDQLKASSPECHPEVIDEFDETDPRANLTALCVSVQCMAKKEGVVDDEGYVTEAAFLGTTDNIYTEQSLESLAKQFAPDCIKKANEFAKAYMDSPANKRKCNLAPILACACVRVKVEENCPADLRIDNQQCDEMRQKMVKWWSTADTAE